MSDRRRLCVVGGVAKKPSGKSTGFATREQRLPASPPLLAQRVSASGGPGIMAAVRARYRDALELLFGTPPRVLNASCVPSRHSSENPSPQLPPNSSTQRTGAPVRHVEELKHPTRSRPRRSPKRTRQKLLASPSSAGTHDARMRPSDQVVPEGRPPTDSITPSPSSLSATSPSNPPAVCSQSDNCRCGEDLWTAGGVGPELMLRTAEELSEQIFRLYGKAVDPETSNVDYAALEHWDTFHHYLRSARKLRYFDPLLLSDVERKAFFLNIYNSLMIHAIAVMSKPRTMFERISLYNTAAYDIGGRPYTLNMIEHGVLRSNRPGSGPFAQPPFADSDARKQCALPSVDPRIHFALNCGARSCPAVRFYEADSLDRTLDAATRAYLQDVEVDQEKRTITLPKLLHWYKADFSQGGDLHSFIRWTLPYLDEEKREAINALLQDKEQRVGEFKVVYAGYDWTVNDSAL